MRAALFESFNQPYVVKDVPVPTELHPYQMLLRTGAAGFCHTDELIRTGGMPVSLKHDLIGGHEPAGTVVDLGEDAAKYGWHIGQRVGALGYMGYCGTCPDCKDGRLNYCTKLSDGGFLGMSCQGVFSEYCLVDYRSAVELPDTMSFVEAAPLFCAGATMYNAILTAKQPQGAILGIVGLGALGHLGVQFAKSMGYVVVGVDARDEPIELAKSLKLAPHLCLDAREGVESATKAIAALNPEKPFPGLDACIVATDWIPSFQYGLDILTRHGTLIVVGQPAEKIPFHFSDLIFKDITVKGSLLASPENCKALIEHVALHPVEIKVKTYKLDDVTEMVHDLHQPGMKGKFVVEFEQTQVL
ncbi:GroES-like protein [Stereum hirsutum FP-91666 SS1]|uniref:GroES-like protein n=1 Tax=Stereum hirsutum (strain FP-91666) TaxID=721885 RepID=UPI0004449316|nr:GroES-like protein [Stereum hirsutum FP-91666 SS1]EIM85373.1 GroES-like protein [Stereum hirsutum FP-91666 SS1]